ncbi:MAG: hypothetical protein M3198_13385, partial [Actinomycetota bacterium]|nr:hypothetical protein [Actinomycetota bacterium]
MATKPSTTNSRWLRVGHSEEEDSRSAGLAVADEALGSDRAALLVLFASEAHDLEALVGAIAERSGDAPLIGCSTAGEIAMSGP